MSKPGWVRAWFLALVAGSPAIAAPREGVTVQDGLGAVDVFDLAGRATAEGRVEEALKLYDALSRDPDLEIRSEARFRRGQLLVSQQRYREAATTFRRLLDEKPTAARVRLELAAVLARNGDEPGARRQLRLAQAAGLPPDVAEQLTQFSRALRSPQRFGGAFEFTFAPDTNVNRATRARALDTVIAPLLLDRDARARSGIGLRLRASGFAKLPVIDRVSLVARATGSADLYRHGDTNDLLASASLGLEWRGERNQVSAGYSFNQRWYGGQDYADTRSVTGEWLHQLDRVTQISSNVSHGVIRYRRNPLQDGSLYDVGVSIERALSARTGLAFGAGVTRQEARDPSYAALSYGPVAYGWHELGRATIFGAIASRRLIGDERNFLFTDKRREWFASGRVGATFRQLSYRGFSPTVRFGYERNDSTVSIYDFSRTYVEFGLSRSL